MKRIAFPSCIFCIINQNILFDAQISMSVKVWLSVSRIAPTLKDHTAAPATQDMHWHLTYTAA